MARSNLERMIQLAEESFRPQENPGVLTVTEEVQLRLRRMHPCALMEERES